MAPFTCPTSRKLPCKTTSRATTTEATIYALSACRHWLRFKPVTFIKHEIEVATVVSVAIFRWATLDDGKNIMGICPVTSIVVNISHCSGSLVWCAVRISPLKPPFGLLQIYSHIIDCKASQHFCIKVMKMNTRCSLQCEKSIISNDTLQNINFHSISMILRDLKRLHHSFTRTLLNNRIFNHFQGHDASSNGQTGAKSQSLSLRNWKRRDNLPP